MDLNGFRHFHIKGWAVRNPWWPKPDAPHFATVISHPSGTVQICDFPMIRSGAHVFQAGPVFLLYGKQWGKHNGFGVVHILAEHANEIPLVKSHARLVPRCPKAPTPQAVLAVSLFVADICSTKARIACEFAGMRGNHRPIIVKTHAGTVILEYRICKETRSPYYSVVTAMSSTKAKGSVIGSL